MLTVKQFVLENNLQIGDVVTNGIYSWTITRSDNPHKDEFYLVCNTTHKAHIGERSVNVVCIPNLRMDTFPELKHRLDNFLSSYDSKKALSLVMVWNEFEELYGADVELLPREQLKELLNYFLKRAIKLFKAEAKEKLFERYKLNDDAPSGHKVTQGANLGVNAHQEAQMDV